MTDCPCGSSQTYSLCCFLFISGQQIPSTAEALMRSRYTAYTQANIDYIAKTMTSPANTDFCSESAKQWAQHVHWQKLIVLKADEQRDKAFVEFKAYCIQNGQQVILHEISEFSRPNGIWLYKDGDLINPQGKSKQTKLSRNDLCHCGSQKKFKKCCQNAKQ